MKTNKNGTMSGMAFRHGMTNTPIHNSWSYLMNRMFRPNERDKLSYQKRGITVPEKWKKFENFYEDMKDGYKKGLTLERIDNNKGYSKKNCKWATRKEQANNRRNNVKITYCGKTLNIGQWAEKKKISYTSLMHRLTIRGWSIKKALETPFLTKKECGYRSSLSRKGLLKVK